MNPLICHLNGQWVSGDFGGLLPEADSRDQIARNPGINANNDFTVLRRIGEPQSLPKLGEARIREIVTQRAERMLKLLENHRGG
jgi:hypothetical protein